MEQNVRRTGVINWVTLLLVTVTAAGLARMADSATGITGVVFLGLGVLVALVSYAQMRLEERERFQQNVRTCHQPEAMFRKMSKVFFGKSVHLIISDHKREEGGSISKDDHFSNASSK